MLTPQAIVSAGPGLAPGAGPGGRPAGLSALAHLVVAPLTAQSLRPAALMRALLSPEPVPARQRCKRVARAWERPWLTSAWWPRGGPPPAG